MQALGFRGMLSEGIVSRILAYDIERDHPRYLFDTMPDCPHEARARLTAMARTS